MEKHWKKDEITDEGKKADNQQQNIKKLTERTRKLATMQGENAEISARKALKFHKMSPTEY